MMRKYQVRFGGGRMEKVHQRDLRGWNLVSRLPYMIILNEAHLRHVLRSYSL